MISIYIFCVSCTALLSTNLDDFVDDLIKSKLTVINVQDGIMIKTEFDKQLTYVHTHIHVYIYKVEHLVNFSNSPTLIIQPPTICTYFQYPSKLACFARKLFEIMKWTL